MTPPPSRLPLAWLILLVAPAPLFGADPDSVPVQRIEIPPERVPAEMDRLRKSVLTEMPREQFEELVRQAARAEAAGKNPPRLIEARYRATLEGDSLIGAADWKIAHSAEGVGRLSLSALQLALRSARWPDKAPALLGILDDRPGAGLELLVDRSGERTLALEWSSRGQAEPGGVRFELRLPPCAVTSLELDLPTDHTPQVDREEAVLSGPFPAAKLDRRTWRLGFARPGGASLAVHLTILKPAGSAQPTPLLRTLIQTTQRLSPTQVECEFVLDMQVQRGSVRRITIEHDAGFRPLDLEAPGLERWSPAGSSNAIEVEFREPYRGGRLTLRGRALLPPADRPWVSPGVRVAGGLTRGERITLHVHPDLELNDWKAGGFRPIPSPADTGAATVIALQSRQVGPNGGDRPQAQIRIAAGSYQTRENWEWRVEPERMTLLAEVQIIARHGPVFQSQWQVPSDWEVEQVESRPSDVGIRWDVQPAAGGKPALLTITSPRSLASGSEPSDRRLMLHLRALGPRWLATPEGPSASLAAPGLRPANAVARDGTLVVRLDSALAAGAVSAAGLRPDAPLTFRGAPEGTLQLRPRRGRLQARCEGNLTIESGSRQAAYRLQLVPAAAAGRELLLFSSMPLTFVSWRTLEGSAQVRGIEPLLSPDASRLLGLLGAKTVPGLAAHWHAARLTAGTYWRLTLDRPLQTPTVLELTTAAVPIGEAFDVPLLTVLGADPCDGRMTVRFAPGAVWRPRSSGVTAEVAPESHDGWSRLAFAYGLPPVALTLERAAVEQPPAAVSIDRATLIIQASREGRTSYRFQFGINGWSKSELPVRLPPGAELTAVLLNGAMAPPSAVHSDGSGALLLPWDASRQRGESEIRYVIVGSTLDSISRVNAAVPELPGPAAVKQIWRLPAGIVPLSWRRWRAAPGEGMAWIPGLRPLDSPAVSDRTPDLISTHPPRAGESLGQWLQRIASNRLSGGAVVLDTTALAEAGIDGAYRLPRPAASHEFGRDDFGVALLDHGHGLVITTSRQARRWNGRLPAEVSAAVEETAARGRDASGRFEALPDWLERTRVAGSAAFGSDEPWTDWEPTGDQPAVQIWVARSEALLLIGVAAAILLTLLWLMLSTGRRLVLAAGLLASAFGLLWLPVYLWAIALPVFAVALLIIGMSMVGLLRTRATESPTAPSSRSPAVVVSLALLAVLSVVGSAATPGPTAVYLIPGPKPGSQLALVPPELVESLRAFARQGEPTSGAMLLASRYEGEANGDSVRWKARFELRCFRDASATVTLPLPEVQLLGAEFDGRDAFPRLARDAGRYSFDVTGRGPHTLTVKFVTAIAGEADREVRFAIPEIPLNSCALNLPAGATDAQILSARGAQHAASDKARIEGDIGRSPGVHIRWRQPGPAPTARPAAQAVHLWEIGESSARLQSVFRLRLGSSAVRQLEFSLPPDLELAGVSARSLDDPLALAGPLGLADWRREDAPGRQRHRLAFNAPLTGQVQIELELFPRGSFGIRPALGFPELAGDFERDTTAAVRLNDLTARVLEARGWTPARPEDFQRQIWQPLRIDPVEREPDLAYRRTREPAAMLKLDLQGLPPAASGEQALNWQVGPGKADLHATASWSEPPASGPVEWEVPNGVTLTDVRGEGLRSWSRSGSLLQAWFESRSAGRPVVLTLTGSVLRPTEDTAPEKTPFAPPALRQLGVGRTWTQLTVQPREGWRLRIENEGAYKSFPTTDLPGSRWTGFTDAAPGQPVFVIYPARGKFSGDILTTVEASGRQFAWTSAIDVEAAANPSVGPVHTLVIDVRRAEGDRPQLTLPPGTRLRETRPALRGVTWVVDCLPGRRRLTIAGKMATAAGEPTEAPHVAAHAAGEPGSLRRWLALGRGVQPQRAAGLQPAPIPAGLEPRTAGGWTVAADNWSLVMSAPGGAGPENANASVVDVESASSGAGRWLNRATLVVVTDARAPWTVRPPNQAELLSGEVDDRDLPGPDAAAPLTLPIQAPGLHVLRLVWRASTSSTRLPLELPRLEIGGEALPVTGASWTVLVPGGQRVAAGPAPIDYARAELQRAADLLDLSHRAGSRLRGDSQSRLAGLVQHSLRRAELALAGPASAELGPDGRTLGEWLKQLRDAAPPAAEPKTNEPPAPFGAAFDRGTPYHWHAANSDAPNIHLEDADNDFSARALGSIALTALVAIGFFVSGLRRWSHAD